MDGLDRTMTSLMTSMTTTQQCILTLVALVAIGGAVGQICDGTYPFVRIYAESTFIPSNVSRCWHRARIVDNTTTCINMFYAVTDIYKTTQKTLTAVSDSR